MGGPLGSLATPHPPPCLACLPCLYPPLGTLAPSPQPQVLLLLHRLAAYFMLLPLPAIPAIPGLATQLVIFLTTHGPDGSVGIILNRPTGMVLGRKPGGLPLELGVSSAMRTQWDRDGAGSQVQVWRQDSLSSWSWG